MLPDAGRVDELHVRGARYSVHTLRRQQMKRLSDALFFAGLVRIDLFTLLGEPGKCSPISAFTGNVFGTGRNALVAARPHAGVVRGRIVQPQIFVM